MYEHTAHTQVLEQPASNVFLNSLQIDRSTAPAPELSKQSQYLSLALQHTYQAQNTIHTNSKYYIYKTHNT